MLNFELYNPTRLIFGEDQYDKMLNYIPKNAKILLTYGKGSIKKNGIYDKVINTLKNYEIIEFSGIEANPEFSTLIKAIQLGRKEKVDFILAVGGGSVLDASKFISAAIHFEDDPWRILTEGLGKDIEKIVPLGTVLTLPATGSEMNSGGVVSRSEMGEKRVFGGPNLFPQFSVLDPNVIYSLPKRQIANGLADSFVHVMEQYLTYPSGALLTDRLAESILSTLIEIAPKMMEDKPDYHTCANFMWCCTMALNGLLRVGVPTDWATHYIGHELTALYGIDHGRTLAIIGPNLYTVMLDDKRAKLTQYGERVWGIREGDIAVQAIEKTRSFFHSIDIPTKLSEYTEDTSKVKETVLQKFEEKGFTQIGEHKNIGKEEVLQILDLSI
jgi:NADP-dependent alcohol dehydrogenase